jgi:hypothetical protein
VLPESTGAHMYYDIRDFQTWLRSDSHSVLGKSKLGIETDLEKTFSWGGNSRGTLAAQLGFYQPIS